LTYPPKESKNKAKISIRQSKFMRKVLNLSFLVFIGLTFSVFGQNRELVQEDSKTEQKPEQKFALVIGNSAYESSPLKNPVNDARAISQTLTALGFQVILKENINQVEMKRAVREFGGKIKNGGVGLFYFAGHGVQVKGQNYLVPIGATITKEEEVEYEGLDVGFVMAQMDAAKNRMNIVILDACRNNPFARSYRSESNGLASISAPSGTLIAYATAPGSVASDGDGANGLYTQELLSNMRTVGLNIEEVFKRVRISVREKTEGKQTPWESSSLTGAFYFAKSGEVKNIPNTQQVLIPQVDTTAIELAFWDSIKNSKDPEDYKAYLEKFPNGQFASLAKRRSQNNETQNPTTRNTETDVDQAINSLVSLGSVTTTLGKFGDGNTEVTVIGPCRIKNVEKTLWNNKARFNPSVFERIINLSDINTAQISVREFVPTDRPRLWVVQIKMTQGRTIAQTITVYKNQELTKLQDAAKTTNVGESDIAYYMDSESANRFAKALANAARLCGAKSETF